MADLKEADAGMKVSDVCRKHGISGATYYQWKSEYGGHGGLGPEAKRGTRSRELSAQADVCRVGTGQRGNEGSDCKKVVTSAKKREAVRFLEGRCCIGSWRVDRILRVFRWNYFGS